MLVKSQPINETLLCWIPTKKMKIALGLKTEFSNRECRANPNVCVFMCLHIPTYTHNLTNAHTYLCMCAKSLQLYPTL